MARSPSDRALRPPGPERDQPGQILECVSCGRTFEDDRAANRHADRERHRSFRVVARPADYQFATRVR